MREHIINIVTFLGILGIPTIFGMCVSCIKTTKRFTKQMIVLMESQQAQMRSSLLKDYIKYKKQGWIDIDSLDDWENSYQKYHLLGANGVMDSKREDLLSLPCVPPGGNTNE